MKRSFVALLMGAALLLVPALAAAQEWSAPATVAGSSSVVRSIEGGDRLTVTMLTGDDIATGPITNPPRNAVFALDRMLGDREWPTPVRVSGPAERASYDPVLAVSRDDRAVVLWTPVRDDGHLAGGVRLTERTGRGVWSAPISIPGIDGTLIGASFLDSGALVVAWSRGNELLVSRLSREGRWADPAHATVPSMPQMREIAPGRLFVSLHASPSGHLGLVGLTSSGQLVAVRGQENGAWSAPVSLPVGDSSLRTYHATMDAHGSLAAIVNDNQLRVWVTQLPVGTSAWSAAHDLGVRTFFGQRVAHDATGRLTAFWVMPKALIVGDQQASGSPGHIETSTQRADGTWGPILALRDGEKAMTADRPTPTIAANGLLAFAWAPYRGGTPTSAFEPANLNVSTMQPGGSWATTQIAPNDEGVADQMTLGSDRRGNLTAAWNKPDVGLQIASTDPALPRTVAPVANTPPATVRILAHKANVNARWSKLRPKALPVTCRLSAAGTCTFRATIRRAAAKRLGLRLPKRGPYVAGTTRVAVRANVAKRSRVVLKPAVRRAINRAFAPTSRRPLGRVLFTVRNTATAGGTFAARTATHAVTAGPRRTR